MRELVSRVRHHAYYTYDEIIRLVIASVIAGFVLSFSKWGYITFDLVAGLLNWTQYSVYAFLTLFVMDAIRRTYSISIGIRTEFKLWHVGLLLAIVASFVTNGSVMILLIGGFSVKNIPHLRHGRMFTEFRPYDIAKIGCLTIMGGFALGVLLSMITNILPHLHAALITNFLLVLFLALPADLIVKYFDKSIPLFNGTAVLLGSRPLAVLTVLVLLIGYASVFLVGMIWFLLIALMLAVFGSTVYYFKHELNN